MKGNDIFFNLICDFWKNKQTKISNLEFHHHSFLTWSLFISMSLYFMRHNEVVHSVAKLLFAFASTTVVSHREWTKVFFFLSTQKSWRDSRLSMSTTVQGGRWLSALRPHRHIDQRLHSNLTSLPPPPACVQSRNQCVIISTLSFRCRRRSRRGIAMTRSLQQGSEMYSNVSLALQIFYRLEMRLIFNQADLCQKCSVVFHRRNRHLLVTAQAKEQREQKQNPPLDLKPLPAERHFCVKETTLKTPHGATWSTC